MKKSTIAPECVIGGTRHDFRLEDAYYGEPVSSVFGQIREKILRLIESHVFNILITLCILANTAFLASDRHPIDEESQSAIETANLVFFCIFFVEMVLKLVGLGIKTYLRDGFNRFDGVIVILSTIEIVLKYSSLDSTISSGGAISAFRVLRLLRVFKLARSWRSLRSLLKTIYITLQDIGYFSILVLLFIVIYTLLGMEMFAYRIQFDEAGQVVPEGHGTSPRLNFDTFHHAFLTIFVIFIGDDWQLIYFDAIRTNGYISAVFFVSLIIMGNFILLNLFLAIMLGNFGIEVEEE